MGLGLVRHDVSAIDVQGVRNVAFSDLQVHWEGTFPEFYHGAVHAEGFDGLTIDGFKGEGSAPNYAALSFLHGKNLSVRDSHAESGALVDEKGMGTATASAGLSRLQTGSRLFQEHVHLLDALRDPTMTAAPRMFITADSLTNCLRPPTS
jgi:hypothetical protein